MTVDEIYSEIAAHMIKGMMMHEQLANYYDFLGLSGYKRCHEYHFFDETCEYRSVCRYFINHHNKLIPYKSVDDPHVIPDSWYRHLRQGIDNNTKRNAIRSGLSAWVNWEKETKVLYEKMYKELMELNEVASAFKIKELICNVDCELKKAERYLLTKETTDYNIQSIMEEQKAKHDKYDKKMKQIGIKLC